MLLLEPISLGWAIGILVAYVVLGPAIYWMLTTVNRIVRDELYLIPNASPWGAAYFVFLVVLWAVALVGVLSIGLGAALGTILGLWL